MELISNNITTAELRHLVYLHYKIRVAPNATREHLEALLSLDIHKTPQHGLNTLRDRLIEFIADNKHRLAIGCNGQCYTHTDAVVAACYLQYLEANHG